ncbi:gastric mucin protein [Rutstroemia sp. NJR-2017a BBW]|nr:gastric mucin protein [Rutstroemia sp. NJR-2017a BBW]
MASTLPNLQDAGKLVALEGNTRTISEQLRLLPQSHMVMVIAPIDNYISTSQPAQEFDARSFVRDVYVAFDKRNRKARSFLQSSPQSKVVFLNGGSVSARAICIAKISEHLTDGDDEKAEAVFYDIVKDGVQGLFTNRDKPRPAALPDSAVHMHRDIPPIKTVPQLDLRSVKSAISMGYSVDLSPESCFGPFGVDRNLSIRSKPRSSLQNVPGEMRTITPDPAAWAFQQGNEIVTTVVTLPDRSSSQGYSGTFGPQTRTSSTGKLYSDFGDETRSLRTIRHSVSAQNLRDSSQQFTRKSPRDSTFELLPKATFVKASQTTIKRSSPSSISNSPVRLRRMSRYANRTDTNEDGQHTHLTEAVFDIVEDLVIHFTDNSPEEISRSITLYKNGQFPIIPFASPRSLPTPPRTAQADEFHFQGKIDADPFYLSEVPVLEDLKRRAELAKKLVPLTSENEDPPTPTLTPTVASRLTQKFYEFSALDSNIPVGIQDEFRLFLTTHLVEESRELDEFRSLLMPGLGEFWKPMFRNRDTIGDYDALLDQIVAVGCEKSIDDAFFAQVVEGMEKVGSKRGSSSRSGRLDLSVKFLNFTNIDRYLTTLAMRSFMAQPSAMRKDLDPLTDERLLASLILPHLETYLATTEAVRFLVLTFRHDQIALVLAMRNLLGSDIFKVAGVLDTFSSDPPAFAQLPRRSAHLSMETIASSAQSKRSPLYFPSNTTFETFESPHPPSPPSSFSEADYHLPYPASTSEIQNFLLLIRKNVAIRSQWYITDSSTLPPLLSPRKEAYITEDDIPSAPDDEDIDHSNLHPLFRPSYSTTNSLPVSLDLQNFPSPPAPPPHRSSSLPLHAQPPLPLHATSSYISTSSYRDSATSPPQQLPPTPHYDQQTYQALFNSTEDHEPDFSFERSIESYGDRNTEKEREGKKKKRLTLVDDDDDEILMAEMDSDDDAYDRMVMGRHGCSSLMLPRVRGAGMGRRGNSRKALKWLGLA